MKIILLAAFLFCGTIGYSQSRLGSSFYDIYSEFKHLYPETSTNDDGEMYMIVRQEKFSTFHYFNTDRTSIKTIIYPHNDGILNGIVELYNKNYVIVNNRAWKMYANGTIAQITLVTYKEITFFVWEYAE